MNQRERRRAAERERQQTEIRAVALRVFAEAGYEGASMNTIAAESGYSVGHIYNVIGNKAAVFDAVMVDGASQLVDLIAAAEKAHPGDPVHAIDRVIDTALDFFDEHREFFEIYLRHAAGLRANVERVFSPALVQLKKKMDSSIKRLFQKAADKGVTADLPVSDMAIALSELVNGFIGVWAMSGYRGQVSRKSKVIKQILWNGVGARVRSTSD